MKTVVHTPETRVVLEGTGKSRHMPKGELFSEIEVNADMLVEQGFAKKSDKELATTENVELQYDYHGSKEGDVIEVSGKTASEMERAGVAKVTTEKKEAAKTVTTSNVKDESTVVSAPAKSAPAKSSKK